MNYPKSIIIVLVLIGMCSLYTGVDVSVVVVVVVGLYQDRRIYNERVHVMISVRACLSLYWYYSLLILP